VSEYGIPNIYKKLTDRFFPIIDDFIMRKLILLFLFISFYTVAYNQIIKGTVLDKKTNDTICFASVYFNATFTGTTSDRNGNFELDIFKNRSMPLTISAIGYYSVTFDNFSTSKPLMIYLTPKTYELNGVAVAAKSLERKRRRNLDLFKEEFLGTTGYAANCVILNENDITFNYDSDRDTLKAFAMKPIQIDNRILGYKITYYLDKFEYYKNKNATFFRGNIIFSDDAANEQAKEQFYERMRKFTYLGSRMHFFRALWSDKLKSAGFIIKNSTGDYLTYKDIVFQDGDNKYMKYPGNLYVSYNINSCYIAFFLEQVYFDNTGYFDPEGINWKGEMGEQRIADWLPYEYSVDK